MVYLFSEVNMGYGIVDFKGGFYQYCVLEQHVKRVMYQCGMRTTCLYDEVSSAPH